MEKLHKPGARSCGNQNKIERPGVKGTPLEKYTCNPVQKAAAAGSMAGAKQDQ